MVACMMNAKAVAIKETKNNVHLATSPSSGEDGEIGVSWWHQEKMWATAPCVVQFSLPHLDNATSEAIMHNPWYGCEA